MDDWTSPSKDTGTDPLAEGELDDPEEVDAEENVEKRDEDEAVP